MPDSPDITWAKAAFSGDRGTSYDRYANYLTGDQPLGFAIPTFETAFGKLFRPFAYNRCSNVIDAMADRMQVTGFESTEKTLAQEAEQIWNDNQMDDREGQVNREWFSMGDGYVYVEVDPDTGDIVVWPQSARDIRVRYDTERPGRIAVAVKHWTDTTLKRHRLNLYYPDRIEKYIGRTQATVSAAGDVQPLSPGDISSYEEYKATDAEGREEPWPLPLAVTDTVPIFHFANNAGVNSYGISELHDVIPVQDALNMGLMAVIVAMQFKASPQWWMLNVDVESEGAAETIQRIVSGYDRILSLVGENASLGEFSAADIQQYTDIVELFDTLISRVAKVPVHYLKMSGDFPSGTALRLAETPFVAKMTDRQKSGKAVWSEVMRYAVRLKRKDASGVIKRGAITPTYLPAAPLSEEEQIALMLDQKTLGLPLGEILRSAGWEEERITKVMEALDEEQDRAAARFNRGISLVEGNVA